jgi:tRNA uracil 4-sulfurtransferase
MSQAILSTKNPQGQPQAIHRFRHLLCHYGELALRKGNRRLFEDRLAANLRQALASIGNCTVHRMQGRFLVEFAESHEENAMAAAVSKVFGLANAQPVWSVGPTLSEIQAAIPQALAGASFASFAVRCRRSEKRVPFTSQEVCIAVGAQIQQLAGARVDLGHPEWTCWIEGMADQVFISTKKIEGPAGLPVGVSGKVAVMLSGGIDSPVAAWRMMRRGCELVAIHFHSHPYTTVASQENVAELAQTLADWHGRPLSLAMVPFGEIQKHIVANAPEPYRVILYRRYMVRMAEALAREAGAKALITGDSLGQVASQTLSNMTTIEAVAALPILRPLVGMDKDEITRDAKRIGTFELSIEPHQDCCSFLEPKRPATKSRVVELERVEADLDLEAICAASQASTTWQQIIPT